MKTLIEGALLAIIVVLIFLRDWRATLIAAIALPLSVLPTFWVMELLGFSLNLVSLLAITMVTGILVDDAIVEIENIVRHMRMGKSPYRAALEAADEIGLAVIAITLHDHRGVRAGQLHGRHRRAVLQAVRPGRRGGGVLLAAGGAADHAAARRLFPARRTAPRTRKASSCAAYTRLVALVGAPPLHDAWRSASLIFAGSIGSFYLLPSGFLPAEDTARTLLAVELPPGCAPRRHAAASPTTIAGRIRARARGAAACSSTAAGCSASAPRCARPRCIINLTPKDKRKLTQTQIKAEIGQDPARDARHPLLVPAATTASASIQLVVAGRDGGGRRQRRRRADQRRPSASRCSPT